MSIDRKRFFPGVMVASLALLSVLNPTVGWATDAADYGALSQVTLDALVGKSGVYGATAGVQFLSLIHI